MISPSQQDKILTDGTTTPVRRRNFNGIGRSGHDHDLNAETEDKSTDNELWQCHRSTNNDRPDNNDPSSNKHTLATTKSVGNDSADGGADNGTTGNGSY